MKTENKPFAPFGELLHQVLSKNIKLNYSPFFFCGKYAYEEAKKSLASGQLALCLPVGQAFDHYSWPVTGLRIIVYDTGSMSSLGLSKLAYSLLKQGAQVVGVYTPQKISTDVFTLKKDLSHGRRN